MVTVVAVAEGADLQFLKSARGVEACPWLASRFSEDPWWRVPCGPAPYEPSNLATAFTGRGRGHHGCYSYWRIRSENSAPPRVLTSKDVRVSWFWNWPSLSDLRVAILNIALTHPPQALNGVLVSYPMEQTLRYCYPPGFEHELKRRNLRYGHDVSVFYRGEGAASFYERILKVARYQLETALAVGREHDLLVVNLTIVDRLSHFFWHEIEQENECNDPVILKGYAFLDHALATLDALAGCDPMLILSEIGFGGLDGFESLDRALVAGGFQETNPASNEISRSTRAREAVQGSHGIVLSEPSDSLCAEVIQCLREARNAEGQPVIAAAVPRGELYDGPELTHAPDIIVVPANPRRPPIGDPRWARHVNRHLQTGWHRDDGFALVRRGRAAFDRAQPAPLEIIAPSVAALLGRDPPTWCGSIIAHL